MATYEELALSLYPNLPPDILDLFANEWARTGDPQVAIAEVRRSPAYEIAFPGNKRPDGTVKFDEVTYTGLKESYWYFTRVWYSKKYISRFTNR